MAAEPHLLWHRSQSGRSTLGAIYLRSSRWIE